MISESIYTQRTLEKDLGQPHRVDQNQKQKRTESDTRVYTIYWKYQKNGNDSINDWLS